MWSQMRRLGTLPIAVYHYMYFKNLASPRKSRVLDVGEVS